MSSTAETEGNAPAPARPRAGWRERLDRGAGRFALATVAGLVLAGIVHIIAVLMIPGLSDRDAESLYGVLGVEGRAEIISSGTGTTLLREADPAVVVSVCGYDLSEGPLRIVARTGLLPLSLSVHRRGGALYAITDRAAVRGVLEFVLLTEAQRDERLAADDEAQTAGELRVVSDTPTGLVVARVLTRRPSDRPEAEAMARAVACGLAD